MNIIFQNPTYLWLLISIPLLIVTHFFVLKHLKTRAWKFANFEAIKRVTGGSPSTRNAQELSKNIFLLLIKIFILTMMILAIANPVAWYIGQSSERSFIIAIDASSSMLANDFYPTRLAAAKESASVFVTELPKGARAGFVSFSGTSYVEHEISTDKDALNEKIKKLKIKSTGGTDLGEAIVTSVNMLIPEKKGKTIVLLTDGRSNVGSSLRESIDYAIEKKVVVHTIGVGTEEGGSFIKGNLISRLDEESLTKIADETGGVFHKAENEEELKNAYIEISDSTKDKISIEMQLPLIMLALALIFIEWGLVNTRYRTLP